MNEEAIETVPEQSSDLGAVISYIDDLRSENQSESEKYDEIIGYFRMLGLTEGEGSDGTASDGVLYLLREIRSDGAPHPLLTTNFAQYTVLEGLLLLLVLLKVIEICIRMVKGGFSWLMS